MCARPRGKNARTVLIEAMFARPIICNGNAM
jgi:hypothetical protein